MGTSPITVGYLHTGSLSSEQRTALEWCRASVEAVEPVSLDSLREWETSVGRFDVLWWHADDEIEDLDRVAECEPWMDSYLEEGGGLLLSLRTLEAVSALGIDPVAPDESGAEWLHEETGFLIKSLHRDHPAFDGFDDLRVRTRGSEVPQPFARYEKVLPANGEVLASTIRGPHDVPKEVTLVGWQQGAGTVLGVGAGFAFDELTNDACATNRARLARNCLQALGDGYQDDLVGRPKDAPALRRLRKALADDPHRPAYHLSAPAGWLNDPNGLIQWNGRYHVFYQYNPGGPYHHSIHWGHAVSDDLVHWRDRPVALSPDPDGPDRDGCWSGCAVDDDGVPTILYTGGRGRWQLPCLATSEDPDLRTWDKDPENPIITEPPTDPDVLTTEHWEAEFRDHAVWCEDGDWYQLIGSGVRDVGGTALLYRSSDLREWEYVGPILTGDWEGAGPVWECPELLDFGDRQLLHVSNYEDVVYFLGKLDTEAGEFTVDRQAKLDYGDFYAPQSMLDDEDRYLTWGWVPEARSGEAQWDAGWSGMLSLPRQVSMGEDDVRQRPAPETKALRGECLMESGLTLPEATERVLGVQGDALEFKLTVDLGDADEFGLVLRRSPDEVERTVIRYTTDGEVLVDRSAASVDDAAATDPKVMPVEDLETPLSLHVFLDRSVVEIFANERRCLTSRIYPTRVDADGVSVYAGDDEVSVESLSVWELEDTW